MSAEISRSRSGVSADGRRRIHLQLAATALLIAVALGWFADAAVGDNAWSDALIAVGIMLGIAALGWHAPHLASYLLMAGAGFGFLLAFLVWLYYAFTAGDNKNPPGWVVPVYLGWWFRLRLPRPSFCGRLTRLNDERRFFSAKRGGRADATGADHAGRPLLPIDSSSSS